jgi:hypothetical protein
VSAVSVFFVTSVFRKLKTVRLEIREVMGAKLPSEAEAG